MKVWITRDKDNRNIDVAIFKKKPELGEFSNMFEGTSLLLEMRAKDTKPLFGFTPRKGSCKQYELELKEIK